MADHETMKELWRLYREALGMSRVYAYHIADAVARGVPAAYDDVSHFRAYRREAERHLTAWAAERDGKNESAKV